MSAELYFSSWNQHLVWSAVMNLAEVSVRLCVAFCEIAVGWRHTALCFSVPFVKTPGIKVVKGGLFLIRERSTPKNWQQKYCICYTEFLYLHFTKLQLTSYN